MMSIEGIDPVSENAIPRITKKETGVAAIDNERGCTVGFIVISHQNLINVPLILCLNGLLMMHLM